MTSSQETPCFYCSEYAKAAKDYPVNPATHDVQSFTLYCQDNKEVRYKSD